jgi:DNA-binding MarR family transcriptional regulator
MSSRNDTNPFVAYVAEMHRAVHAVGLFLESKCEGLVSQPEALIILHLGLRSPSSINALHQAFLHRRSTLTSVLDRLESKGLVRRRSSATDRRSVDVSLTARGKRLADTIAGALSELSAQVEASVTIRREDVTRLQTVAEEASGLQAGSASGS